VVPQTIGGESISQRSWVRAAYLDEPIPIRHDSDILPPRTFRYSLIMSDFSAAVSKVVTEFQRVLVRIP
jgi:hypothetical protein